MLILPRLGKRQGKRGANLVYEEKEARLAEFTGPGWEQEDDITMVAAKRLETDQG